MIKQGLKFSSKIKNEIDPEIIKKNNSNNSAVKFESNKLLLKSQHKKYGIIYLSSIPKYMTVTKIREIFSTYGEIGRIYLQLTVNADDKKLKRNKRKSSKYFTEGWIEFESKKIAKFVTSTLNNTHISFKKKSKFYDIIWNIKYLPGFKWIHLSERLTYERSIHKQRLRNEIAQAKREVNCFSENIDKSKKLAIQSKQTSSSFFLPKIRQRETDIEIKNKMNKLIQEDRIEFMKSLFGS